VCLTTGDVALVHVVGKFRTSRWSTAGARLPWGPPHR
jgi:hypothetical protein